MMRLTIALVYLICLIAAFRPVVRQVRSTSESLSRIHSSTGTGASKGGDASDSSDNLVEVIPSEKGGRIKVVLKLPNPEEIKSALMSIPDLAGATFNNKRVVNARTKAMSFLLKTKNLLMGNGFKETATEDFSRNALASLGLNALLAYGFVSNVSYISCLILSWISFSGSTKLSPLAPEQWKPFLAIYAGYWAINNILRPLRFSLSLVLTPAFNKLIDNVQKKTGWKRRAATASVIFGVNFCGTISYLTVGILFASAITGVPIR